MATQLINVGEEALQQLNEKLAALIKRGEAIEVKDAGTCIAAKEFKVECRSYEKAVELATDGDIQDAKERLTKLQNAKKMLLLPMQTALGAVERRRRMWEEDERRRAEAEQRRLQEEARKQAEARAEEERKAREKEIARQVKAGEIGKREAKQQVKQAESDANFAAKDVPVIEVKAAIPTVAGTASRRTWKFRITDATRIPRQFLVPDMMEIGRMVRDAKDKVKAETECPGIEAWSE